MAEIDHSATHAANCAASSVAAG
jgi:hypothetical protein